MPIQVDQQGTSEMNTGSCHCGTVHFRISGDIDGIWHCHCNTCQKLNGTVYGSTGFIALDRFEITAGQAALTAYESSPGKKRYFCSKCGTPIYALAQARPDKIGLRMGAVDGDPGVQSQTRIWMSHHPDWYEIETELPSYAEYPQQA
jgi:hypothetical protein